MQFPSGCGGRLQTPTRVAMSLYTIRIYRILLLPLPLMPRLVRGRELALIKLPILYWLSVWTFLPDIITNWFGVSKHNDDRNNSVTVGGRVFLGGMQWSRGGVGYRPGAGAGPSYHTGGPLIIWSHRFRHLDSESSRLLIIEQWFFAIEGHTVWP
jgi:hypothetical protein